MKILQTPAERFHNLPGYHFTSCFQEVAPGLRMHYLDEGAPSGRPILLLHGEPSWSFLYRKMIPPLTAAGLRVVVPDLIGFGKSDKPAAMEDYTYQRHIDWLSALLGHLDLREAVLFCQDWGGLIGLRIAAGQPERFAAIVASNTFLPAGGAPMPPAFLQWRDFSQKIPEFPVGRILDMGTVTALDAGVMAAYDAPFPAESYKAGARVFPLLVPDHTDHPEARLNREAWKVLEAWQKPFLTLFGDSDPIMRGAEKVFQQKVPGAAGQPHAIIADAGHFIQEDQGEELARRLVSFIESW